MDNGKSVSMVRPMAGMLGWVINGPFQPQNHAMIL